MRKKGTKTRRGGRVASPWIYELLPLLGVCWAENNRDWSKTAVNSEPWHNHQSPVNSLM